MKRHLVASVSILLTIVLVSGVFTGVHATIAVTSGTNMWTSTPGALAYDSVKGEIFVALEEYHAVSVISRKTNQQIVNVTVGNLPAGVAYDSGRGEIFVTNFNSDTVSVISDSNNTVVKTIKVGKNPSGLAYDPGLGEVFVANFGSNTVSVISDSTYKVVANVTVGNYPLGIAYDSVKGEIFVANSNSNRGIVGSPADNTVSVILDSNNHVIATVPVGVSPSGVAYDSFTGEVWVTNINDGTISVISDGGAHAHSVVATLKVAGLGQGIVYDSGVRDFFVTSGLSISAISDSTRNVVGTVNRYIYSNYLAYDSGKGEIFVSNTAGTRVSPAGVVIISDGSGSAPTTGNLVVTVKDSKGNAISGAAVSSTYTPPGQTALSGDSTGDGSLSFNGVVVGSYTFQAAKSGYLTNTGSGSVTTTGTANINIGLTAQQSGGGGTQSSGGGGVPGFPAEATILGLILVVAVLLARRRFPN
jgi:YVTN family beta-propeller protein